MPYAGPLLKLPPTPFRPTDVLGLKGHASMASQAIGKNWYVRVGGSNTNGGGDSSLTPSRTGTDGVGLSGNVTFTSASANFTSADIGKSICVQASGNRYRFIVSINSTTSVQLDNPTGAGSNLVWAIGGAWADLLPVFTSNGVTDANLTTHFCVNGGDNVYVGAGVYRAIYSAAYNFAAARLNVYGDVFGQFTGDAGMVQLTAYLTDDRTVPTAATTLSLNNQTGYNFYNLLFVGGNVNPSCIYTGNGTQRLCTNITFKNCAFIQGQNSPSVRLDTVRDTYNNLLFDSCRFLSIQSQPAIQVNAPRGTQRDYDVGIVVQNSVFVGPQGNPAITFGGGASGGSFFPGGMIVRNNDFVGSGQALTASNANISTKLPALCYNNKSYGLNSTANIAATSSGQIVEDYNYLVSTVPLSNVSSGAHSKVAGASAQTAYAPLFHFGQELIWGGTIRELMEPMQSSPLRMFGALDTASGSDVRGIPRPSAAIAWDVGAHQRGNSAVRTTTVTQAGGSAIQIVGPGSHDFDVPVDAGAITFSLYIRYDPNYVGPLPRMMIVNGLQLGVGDYELPVSYNSLNTYVQYSITVNPTAAGILTLRVISGDVSGIGNVYADTFSTA